MADTVTVGKKHFPKWAVYGGIGVAVVGGILYIKKKNGGSLTSSPASAAAATDPVTGLPYSSDNQIDPATGMTYLAEAQQYGSVSAAQAAISSGYGGVSGTGFGASGLAYGAPSGFMTNEATPGSFATNAEWAQAAQAGLPGITGDSSSAVSAALATYLAGLPLTSDQANIVRVALAEYGPVPSGNLQIIQASSSPGPTSTGSSGDTGSGGSDTGGGTGGTTTTTPPPSGGQTSQYGTFYPGNGPSPGAGAMYVPSGSVVWVGNTVASQPITVGPHAGTPGAYRTVVKVGKANASYESLFPGWGGLVGGTQGLSAPQAIASGPGWFVPSGYQDGNGVIGIA